MVPADNLSAPSGGHVVGNEAKYLIINALSEIAMLLDNLSNPEWHDGLVGVSHAFVLRTYG